MKFLLPAKYQFHSDRGTYCSKLMDVWIDKAIIRINTFG